MPRFGKNGTVREGGATRRARDLKMSSTLLWFLLVVTATLVAGEETETAKVGKDDTHDNSTVLSPAEELLQAARKAEVPSPQEILKPLPFEPGPTMVKFPPHHPSPAPGPPRQNPGPPPSFSKPVEDFSNTVGPDFGPVTFTEFGGPNFGFQNNFENDFGEFSSEKLHPRPPRPSPGPRPSPPGARPPPQSSKRPPTPHRSPPRPAPPRPASRPPSRPPPRTSSRPRPSGFSNSGILDARGEGCVKYTEDICLDSEKYPQ
ncbi:hypothetical protein E2C01_045627 [Portunus trituberculatus]|uniref:Uncharacterized protein n=1 Tax=Portunus trituberculatus TaxID=210409 RepID=A0A5B7FYT1_PORTR|nr:hypothetical protein [Portunus trituberculatus]